MDLTSPTNIKELLAKYKTSPSKRLGQNFLIDKNVLDKIITSADLRPSDTVLEIGPGIGTLTQELAKSAGQVIAIEKDRAMVEILSETLKDYKNTEIIQGDILKLSFASLRGKSEATDEAIQSYRLPRRLLAPRNDEVKNYKVVANIPYYLTSPLIRKFLELNPPDGGPPSEMVLMIQKEVAQRICAKPPEMSLLAVSVQFYADAKIVSYVSKNCFWPAPKVDSAIIKITPHIPGVIARSLQVADPARATWQSRVREQEIFFKIVKAGFSQPRKQLAGNLKSLKLSSGEIKTWLAKNNINPTQRAETLSVEDWKNIAETFLKW